MSKRWNKMKVGFLHAKEGYVAPELCPFGNKRCLCQWCIERCNNGLDCWECEKAEKQKHDIYMCTGFVGIYPEGYTSDWVNIQSEILNTERNDE